MTSARILSVLALVLLACASAPEVPRDLLAETEGLGENTPLGGEALGQRRRDLERAQRDLVHFQVTLDGMQQRRDRSGLILFSGFLDAYLGTHLDPLLRSEWQSRHPELAGVDATLRLVKAELLMHMRDTRRMQETLDEIGRRFAGRGDMLVHYPVGEQVTLSQALEMLRDRKWRG